MYTSTQGGFMTLSVDLDFSIGRPDTTLWGAVFLMGFEKDFLHDKTVPAQRTKECSKAKCIHWK